MTLRPGCFQSALAAQGTSPTCARCVDRPECFAGVLDRFPAVLEAVNRKMVAREMDVEDRAPILARVKDYLNRATQPVRDTPLRKMSRVAGLKLKMEEAGIDVSLIRSGQNPFQNTGDRLNYEMTAFVLEGVPFKPKDMIEHLSETVKDRKQSSLSAEVSRFVSMLVEEGILCRKERNIICLVP